MNRPSVTAVQRLGTSRDSLLPILSSMIFKQVNTLFNPLLRSSQGTSFSISPSYSPSRSVHTSGKRTSVFHRPVLPLHRPTHLLLSKNSNLGYQTRGVHHFDTRKFAVELEKEGLSPPQADAVLRSLDSVLNTTMEMLSADQVSRNEFSKRVYQQKVDFTKLKSELQSLDKADFGRINDELERLKTDVEKSRQQFKETVAKARANVRLDLNLEKGRVREESAGHELKLQELNARIDQELSNFKTQIEGTKVQVLQWLIGVCTGTFALVLAYIRLLS